ncbi:MAG TPA: diguanylate cyclase, partial [Burkholderiales bacterium]|nr:diguanylate cyclase [Burkholderiales bacterium]
EEICAAIRREPNRLAGVTASLGIALYPGHAGDAESLMRAADRALYDAKRAGRDQVKLCALDRTTRRSPRVSGSRGRLSGG